MKKVILVVVLLLALAAVVLLANHFGLFAPHSVEDVEVTEEVSVGVAKPADVITIPEVVVYDACSSVGLSPDITALKENGVVIPNAYVFLDKNEEQIAAGDYWFIKVPSYVYGHWYYPVSGLTYQGRGLEGTIIQVGTATFWCSNGGSTLHNGMYQQVDAARLTEMSLDTTTWELIGDASIGDWVNIPIPADQPK